MNQTVTSILRGVLQHPSIILTRSLNISSSVPSLVEAKLPGLLQRVSRKSSISAIFLARSKSVLTKTRFKEDESILKTNQTQIDLLKDMSEAESVVEMNGWMQIGSYNVFAWSVSGVESCIVVKGNDLTVAFDMGIAIKESVNVPHVFITHGHTDHIGGVASHVSKRALFGMKPARYYVPPHLVEPLQADMAAHLQMAETMEAFGKVNVIPVTSDDTIRLTSTHFVKVFPTIHRIPSQGYILYREEKRLKEEYRGMEGFEVAALHRQGVSIHDIITTPEVAYTGDTIFDVFMNPPTPDLLKVKLLITEATFLDRVDQNGKSVVEKARSRGHIHLQEISQNSQIFQDVGHLLLVHFSNKYSSKYICDSLRDQIPEGLKHKVVPATVAASTFPTTYSR